MRIWVLAAAAVAATATTAAQAADFNGPRLQLLMGWDSISYEDDSRGIDRDHSDFGFGIASGYDFQISDKMIFGIGLSTILSDNKSTATNGPDVTVEVKVKRDIELAARVGVILQDAALLYVKAGYDNAKVKVTQTVTGTTTSDSHTDGGFRAGIGTEFAIAGPVAGVIEYRYSTYGHGFTRNQILGGIGIRF